MKVKVKGKSLNRVRPSPTPWTAAFQAPPSMGFSRQEYWSGVPLPSPEKMPEKTLSLHFRQVLGKEIDFKTINASDTSLIPAPKRFHMPQGS